MFNIGPQELIVVLVVALVVVGPKRLPELARAIGRGLNEFRRMQDEVKDMVKFDLGADLLGTSEPEPEPTFPSMPATGEAAPDVDPEGKTHSQRVVEALEDEPSAPADATGEEGVTPLPPVASASPDAATGAEPLEEPTDDRAADDDVPTPEVGPADDPAGSTDPAPPPAAAAE